MRKLSRAVCVALFIVLLIATFTSCAEPLSMLSDKSRDYTSYKDIPGVTNEEIRYIEALRDQFDVFTYGGLAPTSEMFFDENGEIQGFTGLFCDFLTELFDIPFEPAVYEWDDLLSGLEKGEIDFTGSLTASSERLKTFFMSDPITWRRVTYMRMADNAELSEIAAMRPLRYGFFDSTVTIDYVAPYLTGAYEIKTAGSYEMAYRMLKNGEIDAFFEGLHGEVSFDAYSDVITEDFYPAVYEPFSLSTQNIALKPVISVVQKLIDADSAHLLSELFRLGHSEYLRQRLLAQLNTGELAYLKSSPVVKFAAERGNYPISFYNTHEGEWQGIAFDILNELELLTGIKFEVANERNADWPYLLGMLERGEVSMITELVRTEDRAKYCIWPETAIMKDRHALLSRTEHLHLSINEIPYMKVGLVKDSAHTELFLESFPNHTNYIVYEDTSYARNALERGDVDLIMSSLHQLLTLTNYNELPGYAANFVFDGEFDSTFGFNNSETVLCSIFDKALQMIDTEGISGQWMRQTYDYRLKVEQARLPWLIGATILSCALVIMFVLFFRRRSIGIRLDNLVRERTAKLEAILSNYAGVIWSVDKEGVITTFNGQYLSSLGIKPDFLEGKTLDETPFKNSHPEIIENINKTLNDSPQDWVSEIDDKVFRSRTAPMLDSNGVLLGIVGSSNDVTEVTKLQQALESALEDAKAASIAKSTFLANMSHEIRTPMNSIIGFTELAMDDDISPKTEDYLDRIMENSNLLLQIINNVLDISKIEAGKMILESVPFDLHDVLSRCQAATMPTAIEKGVSLHYYAEPTLGKNLIGDPTKLCQVFINLISNAIKFTDVGTVKLSSFIREHYEDKMIIFFEVRDSGIGMTPEQIKQIFEPFVQVDNSLTRTHEGSGLGLTITKNIIELMGGELKVGSVSGTGSVFSFELIFNTIDVPISAAAQEIPVKEPEKTTFDGEILVCEDNKMNQRVIQEHLERLGIKTVIAENGKEGLDMVKSRIENGEKPFDLIFMDMHMPVMDGLEASSKIAELNSGTPVVAMTANIMTNDAELYRSSGIPDFVGKPFTSQELRECLLKYLKPVSEESAEEGDSVLE